MPDEYLPPNKILFLQNLPESVTKEQLNALFSQLRLNSHIFLQFAYTSAFCNSDIPIYTKSVSSQRKKTSHSWNIWTKSVQRLQRRLCTISSWMGRTRSRYTFLSSALLYSKI